MPSQEVAATGRAHFRYNPDVSDTELYEQGYNRVYDTLEPEQNLDDVEEVMSQILEGWDHSEVLCSYKLNHAIGALSRIKSALFSEKHFQNTCRSRAVWSVHKVQNRIPKNRAGLSARSC